MQMRFPAILKLLIPLILGVIIGFYTALDVSLSTLLCCVFLSAILLLPRLSSKSWSSGVFTVLVSVSFLLVGLHLSNIHDSTKNSYYFADTSYNEHLYLAKVVKDVEEKERSIKCVLDIIKVDDSVRTGRTLIYVEKDSAATAINYGDLLFFKTRFNPIRSNGNPKEFDYARYLRIHNIHHQAYVKSGDWEVVGNESNSILAGIFGLRSYLSDLLNHSSMSAKNAQVANALILGQKEYLDKDVLRSYSSAGAMHVLAVSGLHVGIIMLILTSLLSPFKRVKHGKRLFIVLVLGGIWFYALITGLSPSVMRAGVMFSFIVIGKELQRDTTVYQSILVSAFILILIEPFIIFQVGFQLSYLAVLGIVYLQPKIENLLYVQNKILHKAWQISAVSIAAQIATFPLGLYYFHQFPNFFLVSNLLVIPLAFFILMVGISFLAFHMVPIVNEVLLWVFDGLISFLNLGVEWVEQLPYSIMWGISIEWYEVFLLYVTILAGSVAFINRKVKALFLAMGLSVLLLGINVEEKIRLERQDAMYVYNVNDEVAIDLFYGRHNIFISSKDLMNDESKLLFHVKHNWFYRTGNESPDEWIDINENQLIKYNDQTVAILDSSSFGSSQIPSSSIAVLHHVSFVPKEILEHWKEKGTTVVFGSKVKWGTKNYIETYYPAISVHDLKEDGALEILY
jgi:competence protein ComEC